MKEPDYTMRLSSTYGGITITNDQKGTGLAVGTSLHSRFSNKQTTDSKQQDNRRFLWLSSFSLKFYLTEDVEDGTEPDLGRLLTESASNGTR